MNDEFSNLLQKVRTVDDRSLCVGELDDAQGLLYKNTEGLEDGLEEVLSDFLYKSYLDHKKEKGGSFSDFREELTKYLDRLPDVKIELAYPPTEKMVANISQWFRMNVNSQILISFSLNPENIGGAIIIYGGKYWDGTVNKYIENYFTDPSKAIGGSIA